MGDLSEHFSRSEFACRGENCCGGSAPIRDELVDLLEEFRESLSIQLGKDTPLHINSGFRCLVHNREIGSRDSSQHPLGYAVDIDHPEGVDEEVFYAAVRPFSVGIGRYDSFTHIDIRRTTDVYWDNRTKVEPAHVAQNA